MVEIKSALKGLIGSVCLQSLLVGCGLERGAFLSRCGWGGVGAPQVACLWYRRLLLASRNGKGLLVRLGVRYLRTRVPIGDLVARGGGPGRPPLCGGGGHV